MFSGVPVHTQMRNFLHFIYKFLSMYKGYRVLCSGFFFFNFFIQCLVFVCSGMIPLSKNGYCSGIKIQIILKWDYYLKYFISGSAFVAQKKFLKNCEELEKSFRNEWSTERCCDMP